MGGQVNEEVYRLICSKQTQKRNHQNSFDCAVEHFH